MLLTEVYKEVQLDGYISRAQQEKLDRAFGKDHPSVTEWREISQLIEKEQSEELMKADPEFEHSQGGLPGGNSATEPSCDEDFDAEDAGNQDLHGQLLALIQLETTLLGLSLKSSKAEEHRAHEAKLLAHKLPSGQFLDALIRYETALEKKKEKNIELLLKLKRK